MFTGLAARTLSNVMLSVRPLIEHRRNPYDAVCQLSVNELFLLGRAGRLAPPIVVHPCTHAGGELRWHRAEEAYALRSERRSVHLVMRAWLVFRSRLQPKELARADLVVGLTRRSGGKETSLAPSADGLSFVGSAQDAPDPAVLTEVP